MTRFLDLDGGRNVAEIHQKPPRHCHKMVRDTAIWLAAEFYEKAAKNNIFRQQFPSQEAYMADKWGAFVDEARATLAQMLARSYPEDFKQRVYEALQYNAAAQGAPIDVLQ